MSYCTHAGSCTHIHVHIQTKRSCRVWKLPSTQTRKYVMQVLLQSQFSPNSHSWASTIDLLHTPWHSVIPLLVLYFIYFILSFMLNLFWILKIKDICILTLELGYSFSLILKELPACSKGCRLAQDNYLYPSKMRNYLLHRVHHNRLPCFHTEMDQKRHTHSIIQKTGNSARKICKICLHIAFLRVLVKSWTWDMLIKDFTTCFEPKTSPTLIWYSLNIKEFCFNNSSIFLFWKIDLSLDLIYLNKNIP